MDKPDLHYSIPVPENPGRDQEAGEESPNGDLFQKGLAAYKEGNLDEATRLLQECVTAEQDHHKAWNALGVVFSTAHNYPDAETCFQNAATLDPGNDRYKKNLETNRKNIAPPGLTGRITRITQSLRTLPGLNGMKAVIIGAAAVILIAILFIILSGILSPPLADTAGPVVITGTLAGDEITLTNRGGAGIKDIAAFTWTVDAIPVPAGSGTDLPPVEGATASVDGSTLPGVNLSDETIVTVTATYRDKTTRQVAEIVFVPFPVYIEQTPAPANLSAYIPLYKPGSLLLEEATGMYWLVGETLPEDRYRLSRMIRNPNDQYAIRKDQVLIRDMEDTDRSVRYITEINVSAVGDVTRQPSAPRQYSDGQVVWTGAGSIGQPDRAMVVLGFDQEADAYQADMIYRHYNGEWGYRENRTAELYPRALFETTWPQTLTRLPLSQITAGADSLPRSVTAHRPGDILATGREADAGTIMILGYDATAYTYTYQEVKQNASGGWYRTGNITDGKAVSIHQQYPQTEGNQDPDSVPVS